MHITLLGFLSHAIVAALFPPFFSIFITLHEIFVLLINDTKFEWTGSYFYVLQ